MTDNTVPPPTFDDNQADLGDVVRAFMVKGIRHDAPVSSGLHWVTARRGRVVFRERGLECWNWKVPYDQVQRVWVEWFRSFLGNSPVLRVRTTDGVEYQFGLNPSAFWKRPELPLPVQVTDEVHGSVIRQWFVRLMLLGFVGIWVYRLLFWLLAA